MATVNLTNLFLSNARGFSLLDTSTVTWAFDPITNRLTADVSVSAGSVADDAITNAKLANMAQATIKGRASGAGTGDPQDLTAAQVKAILSLAAADISDFNEAAEDAVLGASGNTATINITYNDAGNAWSASVNDASITYAKIQNISATRRVLGRTTAGAGSAQELSMTGSANSVAMADTGTFTPTVVGSSSAGTGTYSNQQGNYTRIGDRVFFNLRVTWTATTGTGNLLIGGLPFTSNAGANTYAALAMYYNGADAAHSYFSIVAPSSTQVAVYGHTASVGSAQLALAANGDIIISGSYLL